MAKKKRPGRRKHIPQRTCVGCRTVQPKRQMVRIVRSPEGVRVDETGKAAGRGAYLCRRRSCWETALKRRALDHALRTTLTDAEREALRAYAQELPQELPVDEEREPATHSAGHGEREP